MDFEGKKLFKPVEEPFLFTARACFWGTFHPNERQYKEYKIEGVFTTSDGRDLAATIKKKTWEYLLKRADFQPNKNTYWRTYCQTNFSGVISKIDIIRPLFNLVFPILLDERGELVKEAVDLVKIRGKIQKIEKGQFLVRMERYDPTVKRRPGTQHHNAFYLTVQGELPEMATPEQFWEIISIREGDYLRLKEGMVITEEMKINCKKETEKTFQKEKKSQLHLFKKQQEKSFEQSSNSEKATLKKSPTIMINGKQAEITVKFTERPEVPEQGKKVELQVTGENGIVVKGELNRKTLAKQVQKIDNFEEWIGAFSGTISEITPEGVVILERGSVQIFERKMKVKTNESEDKEVSQSN